MAANFQGLWSEIVGDIPRLDPLKAQLLVQDAWRQVRDSRLWSFNVAEANVTAPAVTNAGTVTVTQYSKTVTGDSTAAAAWTAIPTATPITKQQFRVGSGQVYSIVAVATVTNPNDTLTLDRIYQEATAASSGYSIYQCYYDAPASNFERWISVIDPVNGYFFIDVSWTKETLDVRDPLRGAVNQPYYIASYKLNSVTGLPSFEFWPHPQANVGYLALYQTIGTDLVNPTDTLPYPMDRRVVTHLARAKAYQWAEGMKGALVELRGPGWLVMAANEMNFYRDELERVSKVDEEIFEQQVTAYKRPLYFLGPLTGAYLQSHDGAGIF